MSQRVAFVTGASRGIGKAIAQSLITHGYRVAVGYKSNQTEAETLIGSGVAVQVDVSSNASVLHAFAVIAEKLGPVDILVNNAGIAQVKPFLEITDEEWEQMLSVNLLGAVRCARAAIPDMLTRGFGRIINVASIGGQWGGVYQLHYAASKAGLINFTKSLAKLYSHAGISSNAVAPGLIETDMIKQEMQSEDAAKRVEGIPAGRLGIPDEVAAAVAYLCSDQAAYVTGQTININGGMYFG